MIAAVVLGGAKITGGTGSVLGTILGVLLIVVINSVLVMVGIPEHVATLRRWSIHPARRRLFRDAPARTTGMMRAGRGIVT